jgi:hypothetical protein
MQKLTAIDGSSQSHNSLDAFSPIACHRCGAIDTPTLSPGSGPHYASARCQHCGRFIKWVSQYTPDEQQARRRVALQRAMAEKPPSPMQLAYLKGLGDNNPPPATMADASLRIDGALNARQGGRS